MRLERFGWSRKSLVRLPAQVQALPQLGAQEQGVAANRWSVGPVPVLASEQDFLNRIRVPQPELAFQAMPVEALPGPEVPPVGPAAVLRPADCPSYIQSQSSALGIAKAVELGFSCG